MNHKKNVSSRTVFYPEEIFDSFILFNQNVVDGNDSTSRLEEGASNMISLEENQKVSEDVPMDIDDDEGEGQSILAK